MTTRIPIKPLSVNECWQGRRFKTQKYDDYETELLLLLAIIKGFESDWIIKPTAKLILTIKVGLSSKNADVDNVAKPLIDILQKRYKFNDKQIYKLILEKEDVKKGAEFIEFKFEKYD